MICEILHPIFDALDDEFGFHGLVCGGNWGAGRRAMRRLSNAQNLRRIKQRKGLAANLLSIFYEDIELLAIIFHLSL